ncbi:hypothetical protein KUTeg_016252 [Tegillarca granosa]|uniref:Midnolin n=1 Tax=Tegillarca granosa TaxID=220873 RepID=A0ABQ9EKC0_TEGGR|nr:hypothetical protein KUTeg_016252 [Tegillarca granosa]
MPNMESGMSKGKDLGVMQALANLSDSQVNDFLSGRAPLLLALRLGDHMMFIQLQLSTSQCSNRRHRPAPVTLPSPGQFSVQDHQEIPSPTLTPRSPISESSLMSQKMQNIQNISDNLQVNRSSPSTLRMPSDSPVSVSSTTPAGTASEATTPATSPSGAVIESMHHIGNGIYSGTFSGTLDPSLQDSSGKPRRDISTILHILNDLLGAHPEYRQQKYFFNHQQNIRKDAFNQSYHDNQKKGDLNSSNIESNDTDLREKVRHLQMMMEEKKLRRKARRDMRAPYQWERKQSGYSSIGEYKDEECNTEETCDSEECMEVADSVNETPSSYNGNNQNLEHETVAV